MRKPIAKGEFKSIDQVWTAIYSGQRVYWNHKGYQVLVDLDPCPSKELSSNRGVHYLRVTCLDNWFGGRLDASQLGELFALVN